MTYFNVLANLPAQAEELVDFGKGGNADPKSYFTVLALFLLSVPGLYSQVKRSPKAKIKRKTFEMAGPAADEPVAMDAWAGKLFQYMKNYNYEVKETGEVITFAGNYRSSRGQAVAITFYMFVGMLCCGLVFSIAAPGGNLWYLLTLLTPLAPWYYYQNADRQEEFSIKMLTSDDEKTVDILVQGDEEEIERMTKELGLFEKGKVYVPGLLEAVGNTDDK